MITYLVTDSRYDDAKDETELFLHWQISGLKYVRLRFLSTRSRSTNFTNFYSFYLGHLGKTLKHFFFETKKISIVLQ